MRRGGQHAPHRVHGGTSFGLQNQRGLFKARVVEEVLRVRQGCAVVQPRVVEEVVVREVVPLPAWKSQVACGAVFEALQAMVHQNLAVRGVFLAWKFKPTTAGAVVGGGGVVLGFPRVGLHPCGVAWIRLGSCRPSQEKGQDQRESYALHDGGDLDPQNSALKTNRRDASATS